MPVRESCRPPIDQTSYHIVFSAAPSRFAQAGWYRARMLGPGDVARPLAAQQKEPEKTPEELEPVKTTSP